MKNLMEKVSLLALSFMLVSTFAVSPVLSQMMTHYTALGYQPSQVSLLLSLSSFAILGTLLSMPFLTSVLSERWLISLGLIFLSFGGSLPVFFQFYPVVFAGRLLLGVGIGLINAKAINLISQRYEGKEAIKMLGIRGSTEVLGSAILTFLVGQLAVTSWSQAYLIYLLGLPILALYWAFVPEQAFSSEKQASKPLSKAMWGFSLRTAFCAGFLILVNSATTLRVPLLIEGQGLGGTKEASMLLTLMMLMGIVSGFLFGRILDFLRTYFLAVIFLALGLGVTFLWQGQTLPAIFVGTLLIGFSYSLGVIRAFQGLSATVPASQLPLATTVVLVGCNLGGGLSSMVDGFLAQASSSVNGSFFYYAFTSLCLTLALILYAFLKRKNN